MNLADPMFTKLMEKEGCQYIGPDQDPRLHDIVKCGCKVIEGKAYCAEHYPVVYMVGSSVTKLKGRSASSVAKKQHEWAPGELEDLLWECYEELIEAGEIEA